MSKRFFTKINKNGRNVIIDKECHIEIIDLTLACEILNRLDLKLKHYNEVNGEQQATISQLEEENDKLIQKNCIPCELVNLQTREIDKLKEENEQLKAILKRLYFKTDDKFIDNNDVLYLERLCNDE